MLFTYKAVTKEGREASGDIEAQGQDAAVAALQRNELVVVSIRPTDQKSFFEFDINVFNRVSKGNRNGVATDSNPPRGARACA
jgi:type II secretory pathway component PulF